MAIVIGTVVVITVGTIVFLLIWWRIADHWIARESDRRFSPSDPAGDSPAPTVVHDPNSPTRVSPDATLHETPAADTR